jgi:DNA-nicking Smr family endonuclease
VSRKRDLHEAERALWDEVTRDVRRIRMSAPKLAKPAADKKRATPVRAAPSAVPASPRKAPAFGVDGATAERLRRGKVEPDGVLDLHGLTQPQAHARLVAFVRRAHEREQRCLLVITGKGAPLPVRSAEAFVMPERSNAGVLRSMVPRWLEEEALRPLVVGVQAAHAKHGGAGALYVYLRRKRLRQ